MRQETTCGFPCAGTNTTVNQKTKQPGNLVGINRQKLTQMREPCQLTATHRLSQASSIQSPGSPGIQWYLWRRSWEHPEWSRMMQFCDGLAYTGCVLQKHTYTHTAAYTTSMQTETDFGPTAWLLIWVMYMQSGEWTCKKNMHPAHSRSSAVQHFWEQHQQALICNAWQCGEHYRLLKQHQSLENNTANA